MHFPKQETEWDATIKQETEHTGTQTQAWHSEGFGEPCDLQETDLLTMTFSGRFWVSNIAVHWVNLKELVAAEHILVTAGL